MTSLWKAIKRLLHTINTTDKINSIHAKTDHLKIVQGLNTFSVNIGTNLAEHLPNINLILTFENIPPVPLPELVETPQEKFRKLLLSISGAKATGDDE